MGDRYVPYSYAPPEQHVRFIHFRTSGMTDAAKVAFAAPLGTTPHGRFYNAMELRFDTIGRSSFRRYRFRRTIHEKIWQQLGGEFELLFTQGPGAPDHPELGPGRTEPPELYDVDMPGFTQYHYPTSRTFPVGNSRSGGRSQETDPSALHLVIKQQFKEWVEGQTEHSNWRRTSIIVDWYSVLWLQRSSPTANWFPNPNTRIARGTVPMDNPASR